MLMQQSHGLTCGCFSSVRSCSVADGGAYSDRLTNKSRLSWEHHGCFLGNCDCEQTSYCFGDETFIICRGFDDSMNFHQFDSVYCYCPIKSHSHPLPSPNCMTQRYTDFYITLHLHLVI